MELIPVTKDGVYMEVHPTAFVAHKNLGWRECEKQISDEDIKPLTVEQIKEELIKMGVEFPATAKKAELAELLAEHQK